MEQIQVLAPSKINLFLQVTGLREDNYHFLKSVMQATSLADIISIRRTQGFRITVSASDPAIPSGEENIAHAAAKAFQNATGIFDGLAIDIEKQVPSQAGLGGGSADAAGVLVGLNNLYGNPLSTEQLQWLGSAVGADVPFCIQGGGALVEGIGEQLTPLASMPRCWLVIAKPELAVSTPEAYSLYDNARLDQSSANAELFLHAWRSRELSGISAGMYNVFEEVLGDPAMEHIKQQMREQGAMGALLSGTGSAVFGIFDDALQADACAAQLAERYPFAVTGEPVGHGPTLIT